MRILHVIPGDNFTEGMAYQDNFLATINKKDGHEVMILSSCATWIDSEIKFIEPCNIKLNDGVKLIRKEYQVIINDYITKKLRILKNAYKIIEDFKPDVIRVLNPHNFTLPIVARYKKNNPTVKLYVDSHQHYFNSGIGWVSYWIFHRLLVGGMFRKNLKFVDKILYSEEGVKIFLKEMYRIPDERMELYPLGGIIKEGKEREDIRKSIRESLNISNEDIVLVHSGKMAAQKKTEDILLAFSRIESKKLKLVIVGSIPDDMKDILLPLINNNDRVLYLGWKSADDLFKIIVSGDLYLQPGSASVTFKQALCSGRAIVVSPDVKGYDIYMDNSGWYADNVTSLEKIFREIDEKPELLVEMGENALNIAKRLLDYNMLAARLYE